MKYLRNTLLMILAVALIMPSPLVLAEGVSGATQESKVDDAQTADNSLKSTEEVLQRRIQIVQVKILPPMSLQSPSQTLNLSHQK